MFAFNLTQLLGRRSLLHALVLVLLLSLLPFSVYADSPPVYLAAWGSGALNSPYGVAMDSSGNVYVADTNNNRIVKYSSAGVSLATWGSGALNSPSEVAVDSSGNVYVADTGNLRIVKYSSAGVFLTTWGSGTLTYPYGVTVDSSGNVYVADTYSHRILKYSSAGVFLVAFGSGNLSYPNGLAVDSSDNVYVADTGHHRIVKYSSTGASLAAWGSGTLSSPSGVAVDSSGNVYVADTYNRRVVKYSSTGVSLTAWGSGDLNLAYGVAVDSSGNVYVADTNNSRIVKYGVLTPAPNLKVDGAGVSLANSNKVNVPVVFTSNGSSISSVGFALKYDQVCLSFDPTDSNSDGIPDVITGLPAAFAPSISYNTTNNTLEVALYDDTQPISTFTDGALFTVQFTVKPACIPTDGSAKTTTVGFAASPAATFGDSSGKDVAGTTTDGTITLRSNAPPTAIALSNNRVDENSAVGTVVGTLSTTDPNTGDSFTYSLVSGQGGDDNASFAITGNTLQTAAVFDYETKNSYTVRIRTTDNGGLFFEQSFTINVNDINEAPTAVDDVVNPRTTVFLGGQTGFIDVLANDIANIGVLSVASVTQPAAGKGSVTNNTTNVSYTAPQANGNTSFTYQASNGYATSNSANVSLNYVANDQRGDCNGNGSVTAADFIGVVLEIFDTKNTAGPEGDPAWWLSYTGDYAGSPRGCDANASGNPVGANNHYQASVTAGDIICSVLIFFGHPCGGGVQAAGAPAANLSVDATPAANGAGTTVSVALHNGGNGVAATAFALAWGSASFDATDADGDGVPDAVTLTVPAGVSKSVHWNADAQRLEVALYGATLPLPRLADGVLVTVRTAANVAPTLTLASLSDTDGNDLLTPHTGVFLPLVVR